MPKYNETLDVLEQVPTKWARPAGLDMDAEIEALARRDPGGLGQVGVSSDGPRSRRAVAADPRCARPPRRPR